MWKGKAKALTAWMVPRIGVELVPLGGWGEDEPLPAIELDVEVVEDVVMGVGGGAVVSHPDAVEDVLTLLGGEILEVWQVLLEALPKICKWPRVIEVSLNRPATLSLGGLLKELIRRKVKLRRKRGTRSAQIPPDGGQTRCSSQSCVMP